MATKAAKTTMLVKELVTEEATGDLVINVVATRGKREYKLPYHIKAANVPGINRDYLMAKVLEDVDALVEQENKRKAITDSLQGLVGNKVALD